MTPEQPRSDNPPAVRERTITLRLSSAERATLMAAASREHLPLASWVRSVVLREADRVAVR